MSERPHIEMSALELSELVVSLQEQLDTEELSPERREAIEREMGRAVFEMTTKMVEEKLGKIERGEDT